MVARLTPEEIEQNYAVHFWSCRDAIRDIYAFESMVSADILLAALQLLPEKRMQAAFPVGRMTLQPGFP